MRSARTLAAALVAVLTALTTVALDAPAAYAAPVRIMPVGDSITEGKDGDATYRYFLWHDLLDGGYSADFVGPFVGVKTGTPKYSDFDQDHAGRSGWKAQRIANSIKNWSATHRPDVILLHIGTNDIRQGETNASTETDIRTIITQARKARPRVTVLLAQLIPMTGFTSQVNDLNQRIANVASSMTTASSKIVLVDQNTGYSSTTDNYDGIHPNEGGYTKMADRWYAGLQTVMTPALQAPTITTQPADATVAEGDTATFTVAATGNPAPSYQWQRDGTDIPGATSASYTTPATTLADSGATFTVVVANSQGSVTSNAATLTVQTLPPSRNALFVVSSGAFPTAADRTARNRLVGLGFTVATADDDAVPSAAGYDLVVVSSTTVSSKVGTAFTASAVPVVTWEVGLLDDLGMTGSVLDTDFGTVAAQTALDVTDPTHPLAAGLTGTVTVHTTADDFNWAVPGASAAFVASLAGDASRAAVFGYDTGDALVAGGSAPAPRVALFMGNLGPSLLTTDGWALFDAAVSWAWAN